MWFTVGKFPVRDPLAKIAVICLTIKNTWDTPRYLADWFCLTCIKIMSQHLQYMYSQPCDRREQGGTLHTWSSSRRFKGINIRAIPPFLSAGMDWNIMDFPQPVLAMRIRSFWSIARVFMASTCSGRGWNPWSWYNRSCNSSTGRTLEGNGNEFGIAISETDRINVVWRIQVM